MQTISIISLKGGVAKTTTAVNMAYTLAEVHKRKFLLLTMTSREIHQRRSKSTIQKIKTPLRV